MCKFYKFVCIFLMLSLQVTAQQYDLNRAKQLIDQEKYLDAAKLLRPLAENGNSEAQYLAAQLFVEGKGVIKSVEQAEKYYLLAANNGMDNAAIELCDLYESINQQEKAAQLLVTICDKNKDREKTILGIRLGYYYYNGIGTSVNKNLGWGLMFRGRHILEDNGDALLEELKKDFYAYLLETDSPDALCQYFGEYYWKNSKPEWTANHLDDVVKKIKAQPYDVQVEHLNAWENVRNTSGYEVATAVVLGMMYAEGVGCEQNLVKAKEYYSIISNETYQLLYNNLYKNMNTGDDGHLNKVEFPNFVQIVNADYKERKEKLVFDTKRSNIKVQSYVPQTNVQFMNATWKDGTLRVSFIITNKAMNPSKITTVDGGTASCSDIDGKRSTGRAELWGFTNTLAKGDEGYVSISFKNMPSSGELKSVYTTLQCQYGKGLITASNVVWDVKYQK